MAASKAAVPQRFVVTARDLAMLESLNAARFLTAEQLEWLHFPTWRDRYAKWQEERATGNGRHYIPSAQLYSRLRRMEAEKLIRRLVRPVAMAISVYKRDADLWTLSERGADLLVKHGGVAPEAIDVPDLRPRSYQTVTHSAEIGKVYAALRARIEARVGLQILEWYNDQQTKRAYDRIVARVPQTNGSWTEEALPVQPDGVLRLGHGERESLLLIEVERDRPPQSWMRKVYAWETYRGSRELRERYGITNFLVLAFSLTDAQRQALMETTAQALCQLFDGDLQRVHAAANAYLFAALPDVHPLCIGESWWRIADVTVQEQHLPGGERYKQARITPMVHVLIGA
jgi:hypothetical protein